MSSHRSQIRCFPPVADADARVLILGSMPGKESLRATQYYAHPRNAFWKIMGELIGAGPQLPYEHRLRILKSAGIALWDVLESCVRSSSLDADIERAAANDLAAFLARHPHITHAFFNGAKAEQCFRAQVELPPSLSLKLQRLPSTSPAHAGMSYRDKLRAWHAVIHAASAER